MVTATDLLGPGGPQQEPEVTADTLLGPSQPRIAQFQQEAIEDPRFFIDRSTIAKMSLARDPESQLRSISQDEGIPLEQLGMLDGRPVLKDPQGQQFALIPSGINTRSAATLFGELPATLGGTLGAVSGGFAGGALGTSIGESARQLMSNLVTGERLSVDESLLNQSIEQGFNLASEGIGRGVAKAFNIGRTSKIGKMMDPRRTASANKIIAKANRFGINNLTPAEATELQSLRTLEKVLQRTGGGSDEVIQDFLSIRNVEIEDAVVNLMDDISVEGSAVQAGRQVRTAAQEALQEAQEQLQSQAGPLYQSAFQSGQPIDISDTLKTIKGIQRANPTGSKLRAAMNKVERLLTFTRKDSTKKLPRTQLELLHNAKIEIDRMLGQFGDDSLSKAQKVQLAKVKGSLREALKTNSDYAQAIGIYEEGMPAVTQLSDSLVGVLGDVKDTSLHTVSNKIFDPGLADASTVKQVRKVIQAQNPEAWDAIVRSKLQREWFNISEAATASASPRGAMFRKRIFGSKAKQKMWEAALTPDQFRTVSDLMDVLERTGKVFSTSESITFFAQEMAKDLKGNNAATAFFSLLSPQEVGTKIAGHIQSVLDGKHAANLARIVTSPDGLAQIAKLKRLGPGSTRQIIELARLTGFSARQAFGPEPDIQPGAFGPSGPRVREQQQQLLQQLNP